MIINTMLLKNYTVYTFFILAQMLSYIQNELIFLAKMGNTPCYTTSYTIRLCVLGTKRMPKKKIKFVSSRHGSMI